MFREHPSTEIFVWFKKKKKREQACSCHVCSRLSYKNQTKDCCCLGFYLLLICGGDRRGFSSDSCGNWCQQSNNPRQNPSFAPHALLGCCSFPWMQLYWKAPAISASGICSSQTFLPQQPVSAHILRGL